jgi:hypothetical protein
MLADDSNCDNHKGQCHAAPQLALFKQENHHIQREQAHVPENENLKDDLDEMQHLVIFSRPYRLSNGTKVLSSG